VMHVTAYIFISVLQSRRFLALEYVCLGTKVEA
jgi:hypothetical protein